ncbi:hypothetical protein EVJ58_g4119 [Rhodofomes roseus]|uniref:Uncharacterized protein n=1 Tax=Rhodofomes roseus TaxID=34475 RepID=A0A4Y9YJ70_9APHY|nr:hypothetical protein EVJ58_g4119 [Rhodofomes roseus]
MVGSLGETIRRSIRCKSRERSNVLALMPEGHTFEEHREEVEDPPRAERRRETALRAYKKLAEHLKNAAHGSDEPEKKPFGFTRVNRNDITKRCLTQAHTPVDVAQLLRDEPQDADPKYVNKLLDWAEDKARDH